MLWSRRWRPGDHLYERRGTGAYRYAVELLPPHSSDHPTNSMRWMPDDRDPAPWAWLRPGLKNESRR